jgi:hypothetical protein
MQGDSIPTETPSQFLEAGFVPGSQANVKQQGETESRDLSNDRREQS